MDKSHLQNVLNFILKELEKAEIKHPAWPTDKIHQAARLAEECGEAVQAALDCHYAGGDIEKLRTELAHTGAMAIRCLMHIDDKPKDKVVYPGSCGALKTGEFWGVNMSFPYSKLETDRNLFCGKCYKLDRIKNRCDKYGKDLAVDSPGKFAVFLKCDECLNKKP